MCISSSCPPYPLTSSIHAFLPPHTCASKPLSKLHPQLHLESKPFLLPPLFALIELPTVASVWCPPCGHIWQESVPDKCFFLAAWRLSTHCPLSSALQNQWAIEDKGTACTCLLGPLSRSAKVLGLPCSH
jgi:hypothetical protein